MTDEPILSVENLRISFPAPSGRVEVVRGISFDLRRERLGIVGESGSGKSMTGRAILRLVRPPGRVSADRLHFEGTDLPSLGERQMRAIRGARISMIMQDPKFSLNPVMSIGAQIAEALTTHERIARRKLDAAVIAMLDRVRIKEPERVSRMYPHQVSGGMGQRVTIAMMLIPRPSLLIADEPTSALDASTQDQVLELIDELVRETGMGLILVSHDLGLVSRFCDRIIVMKAGEIVETCDADALASVSHPYTRGLLDAVPRMDERRDILPTLDRTQWEGT